MRRLVWYSGSLAAIAALAGVAFVLTRNEQTPGHPPSTALAQPAFHPEPAVVVAPGRIEPISEEIQISSEINAKLRTVPVNEGDRIHRGQVLVVLENDDYRASVKSAEALVKVREAELERTIRGARAEERREALSEAKAAEAALDNAQTALRREQIMYQYGIVALAERDRVESELHVAESRHRAAEQHFAFVDAEARVEDHSKAEANLAIARAEVEESRARFAKTVIHSPIDGVVLRKRLKAGETVSGAAGQTILTIADLSKLRVRVDVDEADVARIRLGQKAYCTAAAYPGQKFWGRVVQISRILGKKRFRTDEPTEHVDTKILETLLQLEPNQSLPVGLRVNAFFFVGAEQ